ncbi:hypothetical protein ACFWFX_17365, partial [Streptomyces roseolus]
MEAPGVGPRDGGAEDDGAPAPRGTDPVERPGRPSPRSAVRQRHGQRQVVAAPDGEESGVRAGRRRAGRPRRRPAPGAG